MEYRKLPHGEEQISIIGLGNSSLGTAGEKEAQETVAMAIENGINYFDMAAGDATPFPAYGRAVEGCRDKVYFQVHFGADYRSGSYGWTLNLDEIKRSVDWQLKALKTDYIDFGFIHCIDEISDLNTAQKHGTIQYMEDLKRQGVIRHLGLSSHTPSVVEKVLDMKILDMLMFSINPAYDYRHGEYAIGSGDERHALYRRCEAEGVGISVMKAFSGGQLLDAKTSPFGQALTKYQCMAYALDRPGVLTVLPGVRNREDLKEILGYLDASEEAKDYSAISSFTPPESAGKCVYCNHCQPCPAGLDIGLINKYYDLSMAGDALAKDHYVNLAVKASDCLSCGHCDRRCPFHVEQQARMAKIAEYFGV
ncbi:MAG TPA: aldo/keto reductase [Candidatus Scybalocola faecigallinarum]|uniref:Aldo/keto reductase n=1 Tax=Candidatus Scybalocola faecigallinarum TaxID=2840941 RepID=A0A9D1F6V3_9FIRM|nr:aldo/keto reductase [Candidatus Scybalocola faecigallinarum]